MTLFQTLINHSKNVLRVLLVGDVSMVLLHIFWGSSTPFFSLDHEQNLSTWYQSAKLLFFGLFFVTTWLSRAERTPSLLKPSWHRFLVPLGLLLALIGLDDLFQVHENIYRFFDWIRWEYPSKIAAVAVDIGYRSSLWLLYYTPLLLLFFFWAGFWLRVFREKRRENFRLFVLSIVFLALILGTEILSSTGIFSSTTYFLLITLEETSELFFASTLILLGLQTLRPLK